MWCIMLFKLFTQRKEMERKLGELHETERERGERVGVRDNEIQRRETREREDKCAGFMQEAMRPPLCTSLVEHQKRK